MSTAATCRIARAQVHVEDRGYQFADGVYEVCEVRGGRLVDERRHMERLERSLGELRIAMPMPRTRSASCCARRCARNRVRDGIVYLQVTRGVARRDHAFPPPGTPPSLVVTARTTRSRRSRADGGRRRRGHHRAGQPLGARRHQVGLAAAERARQAGGARAGRQRSLVRRCATASSPKARRPMPGS